MKVMTIFGTRPEIIRLSLILKKLDEHCEHTTVHTGQNYDAGLSDVFLDELGVRAPDEHMGVRAKSFGSQIGQILEISERLMQKYSPDKILILGDTNSAISAFIAARMGIPVFHMEAGNRCFDNRVPEEVNRRIIDHSSTILLPYTNRSKENLVREGIERERIYVTGNPIKEVIDHFTPKIDGSNVKATLEVSAGNYLLATLHRSENVDLPARLKEIFDGLERVVAKLDMPLLISVHPRTKGKLTELGVEKLDDRIKLLEPLGFFDFVNLERDAALVLTDSGTVQEECAIFKVPNVTVRDVTERPETIEGGSNIISGGESDSILKATELAVASGAEWNIPAEYLNPTVSDTVVRLLLGYTSIRKHFSR